MRAVFTQSATQLARRIREGELSSADVVEAHIDRIGRVNPSINAVVSERFDAARSEADAADRRLARSGPDSLPPLHGVPCTIKECFACSDMPNTAGLVARKGLRSARDATAVARLRAAGAIPLGVTNVSELCMWLESNNQVYGRTGNAYRPERIAGGSSGGEGAIVGSGASPFGLGSDVGGSIRLPAFFNGVFGHKPTGGLVPGTGQFPIAQGAALRYLATGPLCRRAEDLMPLLGILAGADGEDLGCSDFSLGDPAAVDVASLRVVDLRGNGLSRVSDELTGAQAQVSDYLAGLGASVSSPSFPALRHSFEIWAAMLSQAEGSGRFRKLMRRSGAIDMFEQLALWAVGRSPHTFPAIALGLVEDACDLLPRLATRSVERGRRLKAELSEEIGNHGVMLYPSFVCTAPPHRRPAMNMIKYSVASAYACLINVLEFPATQVPLGLSHEGLPLGLQVVSTPGNDHLTIAVALELERAFGGWSPLTQTGFYEEIDHEGHRSGRRW